MAFVMDFRQSIALAVPAVHEILLLSGLSSKLMGQSIFGLDDIGYINVLYTLENPVNMLSILNNQIVGYNPANRDIIFDLISIE